MATAVTSSTFKKEVLEAKGLVMVDFWAAWCAPCVALAPILEQLHDDYGDKLKIAKLNVDENQDISMQYGITGIPNVKIFKDGKVIEEIMGLAPKAHYEQLIKKHTGDK